MSARVTLVLASQSPARLATLRAAGIEPVVQVSGVDESQVVEPDPAALASALAALKGRTVAAGGTVVEPPAVLVACDSVLELDGQVFGKPGTPAVARDRWRRMRGRSGVLHTGHYVRDLASGAERVSRADTTVHFADVSDDEIDAYVATGEPLHVAGAFTVDGLGGAFVEGVEGDPHTVVGISLPLLRRELAALGVAWFDLWAGSRNG